jgi:WD40 repeat protein
MAVADSLVCTRGQVKHMDWSSDSRSLQTSGESQELMFWDVETQQEFDSMAASRDIEWESYTCTIGWPVQGMVGSGFLNTACQRSLSNHLLVSTNTDSIVRLFKYPCIVTGAEDVLLSGHVGEGKCVCFSFDDTYILSVASGDRCVLQWRVSSEGDLGFDELDENALDGIPQNLKLSNIKSNSVELERTRP